MSNSQVASLQAKDALPGQFITTMNGNVMQVVSHGRDGVTFLKTTRDMTSVVGFLPAGSSDTMVSHGPVRAISDSLED